MTARDMQVGGDHYKSKDIQPWDAIDCWLSPEAGQGFYQGNVIKYIARYREKGGVEDLKKARHYLDRLIELTPPQDLGAITEQASESASESASDSVYLATGCESEGLYHLGATGKLTKCTK